MSLWIMWELHAYLITQASKQTKYITLYHSYLFSVQNARSFSSDSVLCLFCLLALPIMSISFANRTEVCEMMLDSVRIYYITIIYVLIFF
jgi:hypothetical protein